jgi:VWFA-related protein
MNASRVLPALALVAALLRAQTPAPQETAETATHDAPVTFESKVNLVPVPVVVRDKKSHAVGNLTKDNFEIYDNGKLQVISKFSIEKGDEVPNSQAIAVEAADGSAVASNAGPTPVIANHFVAYVFDDVHFNIADLMQARQAALKHFDTAIGTPETANTRAAVFTASGINPEDFTSDRAKLVAALNRLSPRSKAGNPQTDCPYLDYHTADMIANKNDAVALLSAAQMEMNTCGMSNSGSPGAAGAAALQQAEEMVRASALREVSIGEYETRSTIGVLQNLVKRVAAMPGQRTLVFVSPGFIFPNQEQDISKLIDLAIRMNVVINAIDGRGLYVDSTFDASRPHAVSPTLLAYERESASLEGETLATLADGTGGTVFQNNNDLAEGFRRTGAQPEFTYLLGFSPQNLKSDGSFHSIRVKLKVAPGLTSQARRGYFAPNKSESAADKAHQDIEDALFTRAEMTEFTLSINTQFFKSSDVSAKLSIVAKVGLGKFHYKKEDGRNRDQLTIVTGLFDRDGNFLSAKQTVVDLRFKDENLQRRMSNGLAVRASFDDLKPGVYVVRLVARDSEGQMISAANGAIEVP